MKIMFNVDNYKLDEVCKIIESISTGISVLLITRNKKQYDKLKEYQGRNVKIIFEDHFLISKNLPVNEETDEVMNILREILNDENTSLFYDRPTKFMKIGSGIHNFYNYIAENVFNEYYFFNTYKPDYIFFSTSPHRIETWIKAKVAESLKIKVLTTLQSPLPGRRYIMQGLGKSPRICLVKSSTNCSELSKDIESFIQRVQSEYTIAIPEYEKKRLQRNKGKHFNYKQEIINWWKKPHFIYNKYQCYKKYQQISIKPYYKRKSVSFFLHYQPERTTLPEGYGFTQQFIAVKALRMALPSDTHLLVKEHPSTFTNNSNPKVRHPYLYECINKIEGVSLVDINVTSFELIDNSLFVATITGNVGMEALLRGKPVVYFGLPKIQNFVWAHSYHNQQELRKFIKYIRESKHVDVKNETKKKLRTSIHDSFPLKNNKNDKAFYLKEILKGNIEI